MYDALKRVKAWIPIDGTYDLGPGPRMPEAEREIAYHYSQCITCGNCLEVCPQVNDHNPFMGAAIFSQVRLFNMHPTGKMHAKERLAAAIHDKRHPSGAAFEKRYAQLRISVEHAVGDHSRCLNHQTKRMAEGMGGIVGGEGIQPHVVQAADVDRERAAQLRAGHLVGFALLVFLPTLGDFATAQFLGGAPRERPASS